MCYFMCDNALDHLYPLFKILDALMGLRVRTCGKEQGQSAAAKGGMANSQVNCLMTLQLPWIYVLNNDAKPY